MIRLFFLLLLFAFPGLKAQAPPRESRNAPPVQGSLEEFRALETRLPQARKNLDQKVLLEAFRKLSEKTRDGTLLQKIASRIALLGGEAALLGRLGPPEALRKLSPHALASRLAALKKNPQEELVLARFCFFLGLPREAEAALGRARDGDPSLKAATDRILAEGRGEALPRGGYFRYRGLWLSMEERDRYAAFDRAVESLARAGIRSLRLPAPLSPSRPAFPAARKALQGKTGAFLRRGAAMIRKSLEGNYASARGLLLSYSRNPSLRKKLLAAWQAMERPRREDLALIRRYDKPLQPQVDAYREKLEKLYTAFEVLRKADLQGFSRMREETAWATVRSIESREKALEWVDRYLSKYEPPGLPPPSPAPPKGAPTGRRRLLPGRKWSALEDVPWLVLRLRAGMVLDVLERSAELLRRAGRLTPWERLEVTLARADAIELYNERCAYSLDREERRFVRVLNRYRRVLGLPPFEVEERLNAAARNHSREMVDLGYFGHISPVPRNRTPTDRVRLEGYNGGVGENCLAGRVDGRGAFEGWYHSPGHHRNLVSGGPHLGVGSVAGHSMWTMVAGGTDLSWRLMHTDLPPGKRKKMARAVSSLVAAFLAPPGPKRKKKAGPALEEVRKYLPRILPMAALPALAAARSRNIPATPCLPRLLSLLLHGKLPSRWRPLQGAAVEAGIEALRCVGSPETRKEVLRLLSPILGKTFGYDPEAGEKARRKAVLAMKAWWEDRVRDRFLPGPPPPRRRSRPPVPGRPLDGPSLKAPLKVLSRQQRLKLALRFGGSRATEQAVERGLAWLASVQDEDGAWRARSFPSVSRRFQAVKSHLGTGAADYQVAMTGLSLLAFLAAGNTTQQGKYAGVVKKGADFLMSSMVDYGKFESAVYQYMYGHAMATQALCELYAYTADPWIGVHAQLALDFLAYAQHGPTCGWRYQAGMAGDTSVTGWVVMALNSGWKARLQAVGFRGALRWFQRVTQPGYYRVGYQAPYDFGSRGLRLTAVGMVGRLFLGVSPLHPRLRVAGHLLLSHLPAKGREDFYYWYYGTLAMFQLGGEFWKKWNHALVPVLLSDQETSNRFSPLYGSWPPDGAYGRTGGRIYQTALAVLMLTTYYRYDRAPKNRIADFTGDLEKAAAPFLALLKRGDLDPFTRKITEGKMVDRFGPLLVPLVCRTLKRSGEGRDFRRGLAALLPRVARPSQEALLLLALGGEKDPVVEESLLRALEKACSRASLPLLRKLLSNPNPRVRGYAALVLGKAGDPSAAGALASRLSVERDPFAKGRIQAALRRLSGRSPLDRLLDEAFGKDAPGRPALLSALEILATSGVAKYLGPLKTKEPDLHRRVLEVLKAKKEGALCPLLMILMESADFDTRSEAAKLLQSLTGRNFRFDPGAPSRERKAALLSWREWWKSLGA